MKNVKTGNGFMPLISLIAILSISLTVNLPGLGISPIQGRLNEVFHGVSDLEIQLLTILPNFVIIPFIFGAGKITNPRNQTAVLVTGLLIYAASGVWYLFSHTMTELIVISCFLGVGCGLVIPLAASMIAQNFVGTERTRQLGIKSGLANFTIIFATLFVGWIAGIGWRWAFVIYLIPILPLLLVPFMTRHFIERHKVVDNTAFQPDKTSDELAAATSPKESPQLADARKHPMLALAGLIALYISLTYAVEVVTFDLPFDMAAEKLSTMAVGIATSAFFLGITAGGFLLTPIMSVLKRLTPYAAIICCAAGLFIFGLVHTEISDIVSSFMIGLGYGVMQPMIYDKTAELAVTPDKSTKYLSYVLAGNYVGIAVTPFVTNFFAKLFNAHTSEFAFIFNGCVMVGLLIVAILCSRSFVFSVKAIETKESPAA